MSAVRIGLRLRPPRGAADLKSAMIKKYGLKDDGSVITDFDLIEMDEGRWSPERWREAWK